LPRKAKFEGKQFCYSSQPQGPFQTVLFKLTTLQAIQILA